MTDAARTLSDEIDDAPRSSADVRPASDAPPRLTDSLDWGVDRIRRRHEGIEVPVPLPWASLRAHFGVGLWPGLHVLAAGTGSGKTQLAIQLALHAAKTGVPVLYCGLEHDEFDLVARLLGDVSGVSWSQLWTGQSSPSDLHRAGAAADSMRNLPFHFLPRRPGGFSPRDIREQAHKMRHAYPESDGIGSRPICVVVDYLQLLEANDDHGSTARARTGRNAYSARDIATDVGAAMVCISSVARERYEIANIQRHAGLTWKCDERGRPTNRRVTRPQALVSAGKDAGEIEYSADSVTVLVPLEDTFDGAGVDVVVATAKGRATGAAWTPMRFTGTRYVESPDDGAGLVARWGAVRPKRELDPSTSKASEPSRRANGDAAAVRAYVLAHPGCTVREARATAVKDSSSRWSRATDTLGQELVKTTEGAKTLLSIRPRS